MKLAQADRRKLAALLEQLAGAVEELLLSGLTTASEATRQTLHVAFQEASRMRLLRLGIILRVANEELGRFTSNDTDFSRRRLAFFLNRAWLLSHGLARALQEGNEEEFERLLWIPPSEPIERLEVVTLGVAKRVTSTFVALEFRLRTVQPRGSIPADHRLVWSPVFAIKPGAKILPEAFLLYPQKQKLLPRNKPFTAGAFLEGTTIIIEKATVALDEFGGGRVSLGDTTTLTVGEAFTDWGRFQTWNPAPALERIASHAPSPLDVETEVQEEVVLHDWQLGEPSEHEAGTVAYPVRWGHVFLDAVVPPGGAGTVLGGALDALRKKKMKTRPPLYGLMHYEKCRLILQPLAVFGKDGPEHLTLSKEKADRAALLKSMTF